MSGNGFTVAKAMDLDVLADIRAAVDRVLAEGRTYEAFAADLEPLLRKRGWWGRATMVDPFTGEAREVQLGSARRLRTIFDANLRAAHARGAWEQIESIAADLPWLRYVAVRDRRTRPAHLRWHGTILRWDDPWWSTHCPPNGWGCRCMVTQLGDEDLERFGYEPSAGPPPDSLFKRPWTNPRTGETVEVPVGIDPGWAYNVGTVPRDQFEAEFADVLNAYDEDEDEDEGENG